MAFGEAVPPPQGRGGGAFIPVDLGRGGSSAARIRAAARRLFMLSDQSRIQEGEPRFPPDEEPRGFSQLFQLASDLGEFFRPQIAAIQLPTTSTTVNIRVPAAANGNAFANANRIVDDAILDVRNNILGGSINKEIEILGSAGEYPTSRGWSVPMRFSFSNAEAQQATEQAALGLSGGGFTTATTSNPYESVYVMANGDYYPQIVADDTYFVRCGADLFRELSYGILESLRQRNPLSGMGPPSQAADGLPLGLSLSPPPMPITGINGFPRLAGSR